MIKILKRIKKIKIPRLVRIIITFLLVVLLLYLLRSLFIAAWVNGRPILRSQLTYELEKQGGKTVLDSLIQKSLIYQEAAKNKIKISDQIINAETQKIEDLLKAQGTSLDEALSFRGQTRTGFVNDIKLQKTVEALLASKILISDKEIGDYFIENKALFAKGSTLEKVKDQVKNQLLQQKLTEEYQKWIEELKAKAKIFYFIKF